MFEEKTVWFFVPKEFGELIYGFSVGSAIGKQDSDGLYETSGNPTAKPEPSGAIGQ
jgi:hypothetical protein